MFSRISRLVRPRALALRVPMSIAALLPATLMASAQETPAPSNAQLPPVVVDQPKGPPPPQVVVKKPLAKKAPPAAVAAKPAQTSKPVSKPPQSTASETDVEPVAAPAAEEQPPSPRSVGSTGLAIPASTTKVTQQSIAPDSVATSDTASLLRRVPGYSAYQGGGVSSLPVLNGLADDRVKIIVGGVETTSACGNHMNPPLSYVTPESIGAVEVTSGVTSVSKGGDSIGGTVIVERPDAHYAASGEAVDASGSISGFYRSNGDGVGGSAIAEAATSNFSLRYDGAWVKSDNYDRGDNGAPVLSTEYEAWNHGLTLATRSDEDSLVVHGSLQRIPYQGFPNQYMDMGDSAGDILGNEAYGIDARYKKLTDFGLLETSAFYKHVKHYMNFLEDKGGSTSTTGMPMFTDSVEYGYVVKAEIPVSESGVVRVGNEFHAQDYDDIWNPTCSGGMMCMMGPLAYLSINGGTRDRIGTFAEWENKWTRTWSTLFGVRNDIVWMDTGDVQPYSWMGMMNAADAAAAMAFNAADRSRTDVNFDATAMARYTPDSASVFEIAYGRKTRSPNLYERYAWGRGSMAMNMIGWFGDGNGYTGNLDLDPEVANTFSFTAAWHDPVRQAWAVRVTPYYSYVQDFIDVDVIGTVTDGSSNFSQLQFANHDAQLAGVNVSGETEVWRSDEFGLFALAGTIGYVYGDRIDGGALYHMMPLNARMALNHKLGGWSNSIELQLVDDKDRTDERRFEPTTPGYALVNLHTSYEWENVRLDLGVMNLFDKLYYPPLGGRDVADWMAAGGAIGPLAGMGRSVNAGITVKF